jgi:NADPH-dependent 2,4-dienoyl-CoA reductase/sulfur reductase-like enzyme
VSPREILILGGGPAGVFAAISAKKQDPAAAVTLLTEEACEPYEKPPLSKAVLLGKAKPHDAPIAGPGGLAAHGVRLEARARAVTLDPVARAVLLDDGRRLPYTTLVIATGAVVRELPHLPPGMAHVHYLRTEADARRLTARLRDARRLLVVGAGLIGLEVAASAAELGVTTTVLEVAPRILARVCDEDIGALVEAAHRRHTVDLRLGCAVESATGTNGAVEVMTTTAERLSADVVVVGTGARPNDWLAAEAGLSVNDGIVADEYCRSSDPHVFAAGDVVRFPGPHGPVRLENWRHAQDQGIVAGRNAAGASDAYRSTPSFWSEQFGLYIQGVGWPSIQPDQRVRRQGKSLLTFEVTGRQIGYALGINGQRDLAVVRRLIERRVAVDPAALADPTIPLADLLKAKP